MSKFSILCTTRNCENYISSTIRSVLAQTYDNWELIIADDCSEDKTVDIISSFMDKRIILVKNNTRLYCGANYNQILQMATGEYCGVLDGDDLLVPHSISTVFRSYQKNPDIDFIWTKHRWCNGEMSRGKNGISSNPIKKTIFDSEKNFKHIYSHWRTFKTILRDKGKLFKDMKCTVDKELGYTLEELGFGGFLPVELYLYRYHKNNMSHHSNQKEVWAKVRKRHEGIKKYGVKTLDAN